MKKRILLPTSFFFISLFSILLFGFMIGSFFLALIIQKNSPEDTSHKQQEYERTTEENNNYKENNSYVRIGNQFHRELCEEVEKVKKSYKKHYSYNRKENIEDGLIPCPHCNP